MKSYLTPERLAQLDFLIDSLEDFLRNTHADLETFEWAKVSTACGDLHFVRSRVSRMPREVTVVTLDEVPA